MLSCSQSRAAAPLKSSTNVALDGGVPATFSRKIMTDVLRGQLKFAGVA